MPGDVGERLLRHPVDHELGLLVEGRQPRRETTPDVHAAVAGDVRGQGRQRAQQTEILEHSGSQPPGDASYLLEALPGSVPHHLQLLGEVGRGLADCSFEPEQDHGEGLPDLVVELPGDALPLALLGGQRLGVAASALRLEPVEHRVEARDQLRDDTGALLCKPLPRCGRVHRGHPGGEPVQGGEAAAEQERVGEEDDGEPDREDDRLRAQHACRDRGR